MGDFKERPSSWNSTSSSLPYSDSGEREPPWRDLRSSMSAISFGFVATAILISMFLIMAIFEHLLRHNRSSLLRSRVAHLQRSHLHSPGKTSPQMVVGHLLPDVSVMMPGQNYPTYIAQPAPLPCPREGIKWPSHDHHCHLPLP